jgi:hypothetical protein
MSAQAYLLPRSIQVFFSYRNGEVFEIRKEESSASAMFFPRTTTRTGQKRVEITSNSCYHLLGDSRILIYDPALRPEDRWISVDIYAERITPGSRANDSSLRVMFVEDVQSTGKDLSKRFAGARGDKTHSLVDTRPKIRATHKLRSVNDIFCCLERSLQLVDKFLVTSRRPDKVPENALEASRCGIRPRDDQ